MATLTLEEANRICDAAIANATDLGIKISISVVDSSTNLLAMKRMDGATMLEIEGSRGKAV
jgi:uncharacterized protein GlcG (DUF336 family)